MRVLGFALAVVYLWGIWLFFNAVVRPISGDPDISATRRRIVASLVGVLWPVALVLSSTIWALEHL